MKKLGCVLLVILAFFVGAKWEERSCVKNKMTEIEASLKKMGRRVTEAVAINKQLFAENIALEARLKDCKPMPETKRIVSRKEKTRTSKKKVASKPKEKALTPPKVAAPATPPVQEETLEQKLSKVCGGGPVKFVDGKWICVKEKEVKVQTEPTPLVTPAPADDFFADAVDDEVETPQATPTMEPQRVAYVAYEPLLRSNCMTEPFTDSDGRFYPVGFQHSRESNGMCRCGSRGCDLRWPR